VDVLLSVLPAGRIVFMFLHEHVYSPNTRVHVETAIDEVIGWRLKWDQT